MKTQSNIFQMPSRGVHWRRRHRRKEASGSDTFNEVVFSSLHLSRRRSAENVNTEISNTTSFNFWVRFLHFSRRRQQILRSSNARDILKAKTAIERNVPGILLWKTSFDNFTSGERWLLGEDWLLAEHISETLRMYSVNLEQIQIVTCKNDLFPFSKSSLL